MNRALPNQNRNRHRRKPHALPNDYEIKPDPRHRLVKNKTTEPEPVEIKPDPRHGSSPEEILETVTEEILEEEPLIIEDEIEPEEETDDDDSE